MSKNMPMNTGRALFVLNYILDHDVPQMKDELSPKEAKNKMTQVIVNLTNIQIGIIEEIERIRKGEENESGYFST